MMSIMDFRGMPSVAVIDATDASAAVWWVNVGLIEGTGRPRLTGAWLVPYDEADTLAGLVALRHHLLTPGGAAALADAGISSARTVVDPHMTWQRACDARTEILDAVETARAARPSLKELVVPEFASPPAPGSIPPDLAGDPAMSVALGWARWMGALAEDWQDMETARTSRKALLTRFGPARGLPLAAAVEVAA